MTLHFGCDILLLRGDCMSQDPRNLTPRERRDLSRQASKASKILFNECISIIEGIFFKKKKNYRKPYDDPEEQKRRK